jgi:2'-5' RNA ligase
MKIRTQLSLYLPQLGPTSVEEARQLLDPIQANLIPLHVTLCREDEIVNLDLIELRTRLADANAIRLVFGQPESFHGHGILLLCIAGEVEFHALRQWVLGTAVIRHEIPHMTLAHPRNPKALFNTAANVARLPRNMVITFTSINLIHQEDAKPWQVLEQFTLSSRSP